MKYIVLPPISAPGLLSAKPKIRHLGEHQAAFENANNPKGFPTEQSTPEATHPAPLRVDSTSYEISRLLMNTALDPNRVDALTTGLPHRLRVHLRTIEHAVVLREEQRKSRKARAEAHERMLELHAKRKVELAHIRQVRKLKAALNPARKPYDPLAEIYRKVHGPKKPREYVLHRLTPQEEFESYKASMGHRQLPQRLYDIVDAVIDKTPLVEAEYYAGKEVADKFREKYGDSFSIPTVPKSCQSGAGRINPYLY